MGNTVSVIIPFLKFNNDIKRSLSSVLQWADEVILINDGIEEIVLDLPGVILCQYEGNRGVSYARNVGLRRATCDYVLFLDSGDKVINFPQYIPNADICFFSYLLHASGVKSLHRHINIRKAIISGNSGFWICSTLFQREFLNSYSLSFEEGFNWAEDVAFILDALENTTSVHISNITLTEKIESNNSLTSDNCTNNISNTARFVLFKSKFGDKNWSKDFLVKNACHLLFLNLGAFFLDKKLEIVLKEYVRENFSFLGIKGVVKFAYYLSVRQ
jgi:glycosyltransferase involved in cell wall biosynthesis